MINVFDIQRGSYHDGPGIRTVVFLKGCPLRCIWCHNPESQTDSPQIMYYSEKCILCQHCISVCPCNCFSVQKGHLVYDRTECISCKKCTEECNAGALELTGKEWSEETLAQYLLKDKDLFMVSGGGVTLSGGEPLMQYKSCIKLFKLLKEHHIHTAIETCGYAGYKAIEMSLPYLDCVLYDVKIANSELHEKYCGKENEIILENLHRISDTGIDLQVRIPVIPAVNDDIVSINALGEVLKVINGISAITLIPYHALGKNKYEALGKVYECGNIQPLPKSRLKELAEILKKMGLPVK